MFVLQDCPICFSEFDAKCKPYIISCGHVFCYACLESMISVSPSCPLCRESFSARRIYVVMATLQSDALATTSKSKHEKQLWERIKHSLTAEFEVRRVLVSRFSAEAVQGMGMSENVRTTLDIMQRLVQVERENFRLQDRLKMGRMAGENLSNRINELNAQVSKSLKLFEGYHGPQRLEIEPPRTSNVSKVLPTTSREQAPPISESGRSRPETRNTRSRNIRSASVGPTQNRVQAPPPIVTASSAHRSARRPSISTPRDQMNHGQVFAHTTPTDERQINLDSYGTVAIVIRNYDAENKQELSLDAGEQIAISPSKSPQAQEGWIWCVKKDGRSGWAPENHVCLLDIDD
ncbi:Zinc finger, C3HC4 type (RING finger) protein [Ceratobasidium theobromae]|uniref:Zinc finger, C3HC4 type (RING finger) protein n=1 Tax=Ceratobasidium theobromae TaxID=1582974 RepID=A0A5N5QDI4_9AGAM|nr:Zinc finger, C3HC4 type (RING finger) protein [Ceratobasidium theobromae]